MGKWLKKYMNIKHLGELLEDEMIFLNFNNWDNWGDKNDVELLKIYNDKRNNKKFGITCFTYGNDRNHFWTAYCEKNQGVCLWFDKKGLENDIKKDTSLKYGNVKYCTLDDLKKGENSGLPFYKRKQYIDENEFRVFRELKNGDASSTGGIKFDPQTLKRIYFNSWVDKERMSASVALAKDKMRSSYGHVVIEQNKVHRYEKWITIAKELK